MKYRFEGFELDLAKVELRAEGELRPLEPQVFALIAYLVEHRDRLVSRDELLEKVWDGRMVGDSALASRVKTARKTLGDDGRAQRLIRTIHGSRRHCRASDSSPLFFFIWVPDGAMEGWHPLNIPP